MIRWHLLTKTIPIRSISRKLPLQKHQFIKQKIVTAILRLEFWKSILPHPMTCFLSTFVKRIVFNKQLNRLFYSLNSNKG